MVKNSRFAIRILIPFVSSEDIGISGFGSNIHSGYPPASMVYIGLFGETSFKLVVVENFVFPARILIILLSKLTVLTLLVVNLSPVSK